jgi:hypothetical protein
MEHKDFEHEINKYIYENPDYELDDIKIIGEELVAILGKEKKQYHVGSVQHPQARYNHVSELINKMETFILDIKESL